MISQVKFETKPESIMKIYRNGVSKLWLRKNVTQVSDEDGEYYIAQEVYTELEGDVDVDSRAVDLNELWDSLTKPKVDSNLLNDLVPALLSKANLSDADAVKYASFYPEFHIGDVYTKDQIVRFEGDLYRIGQDHTAQDFYTPGSVGTEALYSKIVIDESGYEEWKAWDGVTGLYQKGDIRRDPNDGELYKSKIDNNTYGPPSTMPDFWEVYTE